MGREGCGEEFLAEFISLWVEIEKIVSAVGAARRIGTQASKNVRLGAAIRLLHNAGVLDGSVHAEFLDFQRLRNAVVFGPDPAGSLLTTDVNKRLRAMRDSLRVLDRAGKDIWGDVEELSLVDEWCDGKRLVPPGWTSTRS